MMLAYEYKEGGDVLKWVSRVDKGLSRPIIPMYEKGFCKLFIDKKGKYVVAYMQEPIKIPLLGIGLFLLVCVYVILGVSWFMIIAVPFLMGWFIQSRYFLGGRMRSSAKKNGLVLGSYMSSEDVAKRLLIE